MDFADSLSGTIAGDEITAAQALLLNPQINAHCRRAGISSSTAATGAAAAAAQAKYNPPK